MTQVLQLFDRLFRIFKITVIHNLRGQIYKVDSMQKLKSNGKRANETLRNNQKEMIKIKHTVIYMKNTFKGPISTLSIVQRGKKNQ